MPRPYDPRRSLAIDRAVTASESTTGVLRWLWRLWLRLLTRGLP